MKLFKKLLRRIYENNLDRKKIILQLKLKKFNLITL